MYVYNASDNTCYRIFSSSLTERALAWYAHLPPRSINSFRELGENFIQNFLLKSIFKPTSDFLLRVWQRSNKIVCNFIARFNQATQKIADLSEREFIQWYMHGLTNHVFSKVGWAGADYGIWLVEKNKTFIHADDYVHRKRDLDNKLKEIQASKKLKYPNHRQKPVVHDWLGPKKSDTPRYDYTPLKIPRSDVLQQVESLGILDKPAKIFSPPHKRNKSK